LFACCGLTNACLVCAAFTDLSSGFVHLVVEYMDGGSLQDIVDNGGCSDESVLADLSYQVCVYMPPLLSSSPYASGDDV
jgi:hypothetical protein